MTLQSGILEAPGAARTFLEYSMRSGATVEQLRAALREGLAGASGPNVIVAFGPDLVGRLGLEVSLAAFAEIRSEANVMPATQRDLFVWIHGETSDVFDASVAMHGALRECMELGLEVQGFDYRDSRDLTGFEDGTANPKDESAVLAATVPEGELGAGGTFVFTQKWIHDLDAFAELPVVEQERVIGRTKPDSVELTGDAMPVDSHVSRTDVKVDGVALKILRRSSPFGGAGEHGLYFLAFGCEQRRFQVLLERMVGVAGDGVSDRLMGYSRAVSGGYWFAPGREELVGLVGGRG